MALSPAPPLSKRPIAIPSLRTAPSTTAEAASPGKLKSANTGARIFEDQLSIFNQSKVAATKHMIMNIGNAMTTNCLKVFLVSAHTVFHEGHLSGGGDDCSV